MPVPETGKPLDTTAAEAYEKFLVPRNMPLAAERFPSTRHFIEALTAGGVASRHAMSKVPENERSAFLGEVSGALRQYEDKDGIAFPQGYLVMVARP